MTIMIPAWVNGEIEPVEKLQAHVQGLKHKAVSVFMVHEQEILIQRRALEKYHTPGLWANTCCTHPNWGENTEDCARRRMGEELGLRDTRPVYRDTVEYRANVGNGLVEHEVVDLFLIHVHEKPHVAAKPEEVMDTRWIDFHDLKAEVRRWPKRFTPWVRIYLELHSDKIFNERMLDISAA